MREVSPEKEKRGYGGKDLQKRKDLSLEWKSEGGMKYHNKALEDSRLHIRAEIKDAKKNSPLTTLYWKT